MPARKGISFSHMEHNRIVIFDGVCNLCEASVVFIIKRDRQAKFKFVAAQSEFGMQLLARSGINQTDLETVVLMKDNVFYETSSAAIEIARDLDGAWKYLYLLKVIPQPLRDYVYQFISAHRYQWFGKHDLCLIRTPQLKERFLKS